MGDVVRTLPHDGPADINDEQRITSPNSLAEAEMESPPEQQEKAEEVHWRCPNSIQAYMKEISAIVPCARIHTWSTVMIQMELEKEKSQFCPNPFLILTIRLSFISSTGNTPSHGPTYFPPLLYPLPCWESLRTGSVAERVLLEVNERNVQSTHNMSPAAAPAQWVHLTPRPGL